MRPYRLVQRISPDELNKRLDELAEEINRDYEGKSLVLIGILKGAFVFLADLARRLASPVEIDFVRLSSYGNKSETSGSVRITKDLELQVKGRHILIVEDIVDTGITLNWYLDRLQASEPASVKICALIDKIERRKVEVPIDYVGLHLTEGFLVGYGLDYSERHRNLPGIYEVEFEEQGGHCVS